MNVRKIRQLGKDILAEPRRFNMEVWGASVETMIKKGMHSKRAIPPCGTVCCFAGAWDIRYGKMKLRDVAEHNWVGIIGFIAAVIRDLDLPNDRLFFENKWPNHLSIAKNILPGTERYARHFVERVLESYIRENGWVESSTSDSTSPV